MWSPTIRYGYVWEDATTRKMLKLEHRLCAVDNTVIIQSLSWWRMHWLQDYLMFCSIKK